MRDAIIGNVDSTNDINNIGTEYILPSSYVGSPRLIQEYIQDAMTYVPAYGRPDLFITFTCNLNWDEIKNLLLSGQTSMHRHEIDKIISAEIPDPNVNEELFDIVTTNMIHGICGTLNMMSP